MSATIRIDGKLYRLAATVEEGQTLYFAGGRAIAVEKFDMRIGSSEFDYQVTSRAVRGGRPDQIMAQEESLDREFMESRVKSNLYGLPVSVGNLTEMARQRRVDLTYGEVKPQVFSSRVTTRPVAWRIWFKRTYYTGSASGRGYRGSTAPGVGSRATATATGSARIRAGSQGASPGQASGTVGMIGNDAGILRVYVAEGDPYQVYARRFDDHDVIFRERSLMDHVGSFVSGRGW